MQKGIRNAIVNGRGYLTFGTNNPHTESDQEQYYIGETKEFFLQNLQWTHNMVLAQVQGINYRDFYAYTECRIRTAKVIDPTTGQNLGDDWQRMIIEDARIDFIPRGAKVHFNGNTWLVTNPDNIASATGTAIIKRCNVTWNHLDWYGNILTEPFCYGQGGNDLATANNVKINMILLDAYQHCFMQLNDETRELAHNRRILLGDQAYSVRGLQNFVQEFGDELSSVHLQFFDVTREETLHSIDDITNHVADGKGFKWEIVLSGIDELGVGSSYQFRAKSMRNDAALMNGIVYTTVTIDADTGTAGWNIVEPYDSAGTTMYRDSEGRTYTADEIVERSVTYTWESSDESIATVDENGTVTGVGDGTAVITCSLAQNPNWKATIAVTVSASVTGTVFRWIDEPPAKLAQYQTATISAALFIDGEMQDDAVTYSFTGASEDTYETTIEENTVTLDAYGIPYKPLHITAKCGANTLEADVQIVGW